MRSNVEFVGVCPHTLFRKCYWIMIRKTFEMKVFASYSRPEAEIILLDPEENFLESGQLGNVGEGDPGEDEWFN